ncbi:MAG: 2-dehydropantoate 2-reductase N-terminal domain-containing protein, partial [Fimbriimonadales bacterium]
MRATVLGAGSWGTALAILLARNGHQVALYGHEPEHIDTLRALRENLRYLPGFAIPEGVTPVTVGDELPPCDLWVVAVPSHAVRSVVHLVCGERPLVVLASKGLEVGSGELVSTVCLQELPQARVGALSGPNLAIEIVRGVPTAAVAASHDEEAAEAIRAAFMCPTY